MVFFMTWRKEYEYTKESYNPAKAANNSLLEKSRIIHDKDYEINGSWKK